MTKQELENNDPITVREALEMAFSAGMAWIMDDNGRHQSPGEVVASLLRRVEAGNECDESRQCSSICCPKNRREKDKQNHAVAEGLVVCDWARWCGGECEGHHAPHVQKESCGVRECARIPHPVVQCVPVEPKQ